MLVWDENRCCLLVHSLTGKSESTWRCNCRRTSFPLGLILAEDLVKPTFESPRYSVLVPKGSVDQAETETKVTKNQGKGQRQGGDDVDGELSSWFPSRHQVPEHEENARLIEREIFNGLQESDE